MSDWRSAASAAYPDWIGNVRDHKAWAKRILWRHDQGDRDLLHIQIKFAQEAMGIKTKQST